jgi:hypothetical protein
MRPNSSLASGSGTWTGIRAALSDPLDLKPTSPSPLGVVCWRGRDGVHSTSCPLPRETAEALARAYATFFTRESYWVEPVPWLEARSKTV